MPQDKEGADVAVTAELLGTLPRQSQDRPMALYMSPDGNVVICQGADKCADVYRIASAKDLKARMARKQKRLREKQSVFQEHCCCCFYS